jgi:2-oxoglutarate dehydrogenase E1 component
VFLLPHGYEGQGPEHSSARPSDSCRRPPTSTCASPTARRPRSTSTCCGGRPLLLETDPLPLFVLTPKSLLRHPMTASAPRELAEGRFLPVIDDVEARQRATRVTRVVLCSGKVYVDLVSSPRASRTSRWPSSESSSCIPFPATRFEPCSTGTRR